MQAIISLKTKTVAFITLFFILKAPTGFHCNNVRTTTYLNGDLNNRFDNKYVYIYAAFKKKDSFSVSQSFNNINLDNYTEYPNDY